MARHVVEHKTQPELVEWAKAQLAKLPCCVVSEEDKAKVHILQRRINETGCGKFENVRPVSRGAIPNCKPCLYSSGLPLDLPQQAGLL